MSNIFVIVLDVVGDIKMNDIVFCLWRDYNNRGN